MKRALQIVGILVCFSLLSFGILLMILRHPRVQTAVVGVITTQLEQQTHSTIKIGYFHYKFLNTISLESVYLEDQQRDTLLYVDDLRIYLRPLLLLQKQLDIREIALQSPIINLYDTPDSVLNAKFLIDAFSSSDSVAPFPLRVNVDRLSLTDTRLRYNEVEVYPINLSMSMPVISRDSFDVSISDLSLFAQVKSLDATLSASVHGNLNTLWVDDILLSYRDHRLFEGAIVATRPTKFDSISVSVSCKDLFCNSALLSDLISHLKHQPVSLPSDLHQLGNIHYHGEMQGDLEGAYLHGAFTSDLGVLEVNGFAQADTLHRSMLYHGQLGTTQFRLGRLLNVPDMGHLSMLFEGQASVLVFGSKPQLDCHGMCQISTFEYRDYTYTDIEVEGGYKTGDGITGSVVVRDSALQVSMRGMVDPNQEEKQLNMAMHIDRICPYSLHLSDKWPHLEMTTTAYVELFARGNSADLLDNMFGYVIMDSVDIRNGERAVRMDQLKLLVDDDLPDSPDAHTMHSIRLQSDFVTAGCKGIFRYATLPQTIKHFLNRSVPSLVPDSCYGHRAANDLDFYAYFRNIKQLTDLLDMRRHLPSYPTIKGYIHETMMDFNVDVFVPEVSLPMSSMENLTFHMDNRQSKLLMALHGVHHTPSNLPITMHVGDLAFRLDVQAEHDNIDFTMALENSDTVRNEGSMHIHTDLSQYSNKPYVDVHILPTELVMNNIPWSVHDAHLIYSAAERELAIRNLALMSEEQSIEANGTASPLASDSLHVVLKNFDINYLLSTLGIYAITAKGNLTGWCTAYSVFSEPMFEAHAILPNALLNDTYIGDLTADAHLNREDHTMIITANSGDSTRRMVHLDGLVIPREAWWGLNIECDSVDIHMVDHWTHHVIANPSGRAYGIVRVFGKELSTWVNAALYAKDASVKVPVTGATYYFSDSIFLDSCAVRFPGLAIRDADGHTGTFDGIIHHDQFRDMQFDLHARLNNLLALNLPKSDQSSFFGKVYATGEATIHGGENSTEFAINARTDANSNFALSVATASSAVNTTSFIDFTTPDTTSIDLLNILKTAPLSNNKVVRQRAGTTRLSIRMDITPTTEIQLKMAGDDGIKGQGEGNLRLEYDDRSGEVYMMGTYSLRQGQFTFTVGNLVRRQFEIAEGSSVVWDGNPESPILNVTAKYRLTASLRDLFGSDASSLSTNRTSVPVNCVLHMTDRLYNPTINFAIELPQSDESVQSQVNSVISTNEMLMREVIYLLVFNRFYTPEYLKNTTQQGVNETYSLVSSTITGQINSWLSKLTDVFSMGFAFRRDGEGATASQEYEANFSIHPINKLLINGNVGYRYNDISNRPFFGDLDVEYMLTDDGKFRAKAYTHTVDKYSLKQANTVQGLGLLYRYDFNFGEANTQFKQRKNPSHEAITSDTVSGSLISPKDTTITNK